MIAVAPMNQITQPEAQLNTVLVLPVLPGQAEAWRRFVQELRGPHWEDWVAWRERVGLDRLQVWAQTVHHSMTVLIQAGFKHEAGSTRSLVEEARPFDRWLRGLLLTLHGVDLAHLPTGAHWEPVLGTGDTT
jgi:hypothetical protein